MGASAVTGLFAASACDVVVGAGRPNVGAVVAGLSVPLPPKPPKLIVPALVALLAGLSDWTLRPNSDPDAGAFAASAVTPFAAGAAGFAPKPNIEPVAGAADAGGAVGATLVVVVEGTAG